MGGTGLGVGQEQPLHFRRDSNPRLVGLAWAIWICVGGFAGADLGSAIEAVGTCHGVRGEIPLRCTTAAS